MSVQLNADISELFAVKAQRADLAKKEKELKKQQDALEDLIREQIVELDVPKYTSHDGTVTPSQREFVQINDMDEFIKYAEDNGATHLLNTKPSQAATIEQIKLYGDDVTGVEIGYKNTLSARKA